MRLIDADYLLNVTLVHNFHGNNKNIVPYSDRRGYRLRDNEVRTAIINSPTIEEKGKVTREEVIGNLEKLLAKIKDYGVPDGMTDDAYFNVVVAIEDAIDKAKDDE